MKNLSITPTVYTMAGIIIVGGLAAVIGAQLPEIRRYLAIRRM